VAKQGHPQLQRLVPESPGGRWAFVMAGWLDCVVDRDLTWLSIWARRPPSANRGPAGRVRSKATQPVANSASAHPPSPQTDTNSCQFSYYCYRTPSKCFQIRLTKLDSNVRLLYTNFDHDRSAGALIFSPKFNYMSLEHKRWVRSGIFT